MNLFKGQGIEMEYMIVDSDTLAVKPIADKLFYEAGGDFTSEIQFGNIGWDNELALHVIEIKTCDPCSTLADLQLIFQENVRNINQLLKKFNAKLLPSGSHPLMNPYTDSKLWPHGSNIIYEAFNKIFDCKGHGWTNLQSTHINLSFDDNDEFGRLHAAIRLLLPIIPALSASSPILGGQLTGFADSRLEMYRKNQQKVPSIAGQIIPEKIFSIGDYKEKILGRIYADIAPFDPDKVLQDEWLNSRGAIARFSRNTFEIRVIDAQECPLADVSVSYAIIEALKAMVNCKWVDTAEQMKWPEDYLAALFLEVIKNAGSTLINNKEYLACFGYPNEAPCAVKDLWGWIIDQTLDPASIYKENVFFILKEGTLSERIIKSLNDNHSVESILKVYHNLSDCLHEGKMFGSRITQLA